MMWASDTCHAAPRNNWAHEVGLRFCHTSEALALGISGTAFQGGHHL